MIRKRQISSLLVVLCACFNMNSQNLNLTPIKEIYIDNKVVFNDSINLINKEFNLWCCDSTGKAIDTCLGFYFLKVKNHSIILDYRQVKSTDSATSMHYSKLAINKINTLKWNGRIRHKNRLRSVAYYSSRSTAWYTITIKTGEIKKVIIF
jgi:hypothetical protein